MRGTTNGGCLPVIIESNVSDKNELSIPLSDQLFHSPQKGVFTVALSGGSQYLYHPSCSVIEIDQYYIYKLLNQNF